jgi:hypothetical protein
MKDSILRGLDSMALALAEAGHVWSTEERAAYESLVARLLKRD